MTEAFAPLQQNYTTLTQQPFADVVLNNTTNQKLLQATKKFKKGVVLQQFSASTTSKTPTYLTVQIGIDEHITLQPTFLQYCNHSCNPSVFFDTSGFELIALKNIEIGDELTFFYPSSEWSMTQSFICNCQSENCLHHIKGAAYISKEILATYKLTHFIQSMLAL